MKLCAAVWSQAEVHALIDSLLGKGFSVMLFEEVAELHTQPVNCFIFLFFLLLLVLFVALHLRCFKEVLESPCVNLFRSTKERDVFVMASLQYNIKINSVRKSKSHLENMSGRAGLN